MNIFEGSRRIAKITAALWAVGCVLYASINSPTVYVTYEISSYGITPMLTENCPTDAAKEFPSGWQTTDKGTSVSLTLCFWAIDGFTGKSSRLIPYKIDEKTEKLWGNEKYSPDVVAYTRKVAETFKIPPADFPKIDAQHSSLWWKGFFETMGVMLAGIVFLFGFTWSIGYVARGFMGIPSKSDTRDNN